MGAHLDVWDLTAGHKRAREELELMSDAAQRYEKIRKMNPRQFASLYQKNIEGEGMFDDLVDAFKFDV